MNAIRRGGVPVDRLLDAPAMTEPALLYTADAAHQHYSELVVVV